VHLPISPWRYNTEHARALYLADSEDGVRREMAAGEGTLYLIRFRPPIHSLRIADFTGYPADHFLTAVFSKAEDCNVAGRGPSNYIFSQVVAELVAARFDGMRVPGVRGGPGALYGNVVIFNRIDYWTDWLEPGATPYALTEESRLLGDFAHDHIAVAAHFIWEKEGRPHGRDLAHWFAAIDALRRARTP